MFVRIKGKGRYRYLQIVENHREGHRTVQRVLCTLGRLDQLTAKGATDTLMRSLARYAQRERLVDGLPGWRPGGGGGARLIAN